MTKISEKISILFISICLIILLIITVFSYLKEESKTQNTNIEVNTDNQQSKLSVLMNSMRDNPNDPIIIYEISKELIRLEQYSVAEDFIKKLLSFNDKNSDALYLLGYIKTKTGDFKNAVNYMLESLKNKEDIDARFSIGIIYEYYLNDDNSALTNFNIGLNNQNITEDQKNKFLTEIQKIKEKNNVK